MARSDIQFGDGGVRPTDENARIFREKLDPETMEQFDDRVMNASIGQISELAGQIWDDPDLGQLFRRLGVDGKMEAPRLLEDVSPNPDKPWLSEPRMDGETEWDRVWRFIDRYRIGEKWGLKLRDLWLATGLCRERADGNLTDFSEASTSAYIKDRRGDIESGKVLSPYKKAPHSPDIIIRLAREMVEDEDFRDFLENEEAELQISDFDKFLHIVYSFEAKFIYRYCYFNRSLVGSLHLARCYIRNQHYFKNADGTIGTATGLPDGWELKFLIDEDQYVRAWWEAQK